MQYIKQNGEQIKDPFGNERQIDPEHAKKEIVGKLRNLLVLAEREEYAKLESAVRFITHNPNQSKLVSLITSVHESLEIDEMVMTEEKEDELSRINLGSEGDDCRRIN